jgi:uncharacterized circularly permuted ATP-grasp superfamily protein
LRAGLEQRVQALNLYVKDVYGRSEILKSGVVPEELVFQNPVFRPEMNGQKPHDIYVHVAGIDLVRTDAETFYAMTKAISGVSYMPKPREMLRLFRNCSRHRVAPVENYPDELLAMLTWSRPSTSMEPTVAAHARGVQFSLLRAPFSPIPASSSLKGDLFVLTSSSTCGPRKAPGG